jgi:hypothetical protein
MSRDECPACLGASARDLLPGDLCDDHLHDELERYGKRCAENETDIMARIFVDWLQAELNRRGA